MAPGFRISPFSSHSRLQFFLTLIDAVNDIHILCARRLSITMEYRIHAFIHVSIHLYSRHGIILYNSCYKCSFTVSKASLAFSQRIYQITSYCFASSLYHVIFQHWTNGQNSFMLRRLYHTQIPIHFSPIRRIYPMIMCNETLEANEIKRTMFIFVSLITRQKNSLGRFSLAK